LQVNTSHYIHQLLVTNAMTILEKGY